MEGSTSDLVGNRAAAYLQATQYAELSPEEMHGMRCNVRMHPSADSLAQF
jgi:hypothetical protein